MVMLVAAIDDDWWSFSFNDHWRTTLNDDWWSVSFNDDWRTTMTFMAMLIFIVDDDRSRLTTRNQSNCGYEQKYQLFHIHLQ